MSETTGEKQSEEFFSPKDELDTERFFSIDVGKICTGAANNIKDLETFINQLENYRMKQSWSKSQLIELLQLAVPEFTHIELGKNLDQRM